MENILALPSSEKTHLSLARNQALEMGEQLTEQFERATGGMREVLIFGAMIMHLRASIISARGNVRTGGANSKDSGIKAWIEEHAPKVNLSTAYRLESVTAAIADKWDGLPESLAKKIAFPDLVTLPEPKLAKIDRRLPKKRVELFDYVKGTSQRSWLDQFVNTSRGGKTYERDGDKGKRAAFEVKAYRVLCVGSCAGLQQSAGSLRETKSYRAPNTPQLVDLIHSLDHTSKELRAWFDKPAADRDLIFAQQLERIARAHSPSASPARTSRPKTKKKK